MDNSMSQTLRDRLAAAQRAHAQQLATEIEGHWAPRIAAMVDGLSERLADQMEENAAELGQTSQVIEKVVAMGVEPGDGIPTDEKDLATEVLKLFIERAKAEYGITESLDPVGHVTGGPVTGITRGLVENTASGVAPGSARSTTLGTIPGPTFGAAPAGATTRTSALVRGTVSNTATPGTTPSATPIPGPAPLDPAPSPDSEAEADDEGAAQGLIPRRARETAPSPPASGIDSSAAPGTLGARMPRRLGSPGKEQGANLAPGTRQAGGLGPVQAAGPAPGTGGGAGPWVACGSGSASGPGSGSGFGSGSGSGPGPGSGSGCGSSRTDKAVSRVAYGYASGSREDIVGGIPSGSSASRLPGLVSVVLAPPAGLAAGFGGIRQDSIPVPSLGCPWGAPTGAQVPSGVLGTPGLGPLLLEEPALGFVLEIAPGLVPNRAPSPISGHVPGDNLSSVLSMRPSPAAPTSLQASGGGTHAEKTTGPFDSLKGVLGEHGLTSNVISNASNGPATFDEDPDREEGPDREEDPDRVMEDVAAVTQEEDVKEEPFLLEQQEVSATPDGLPAPMEEEQPAAVEERPVAFGDREDVIVLSDDESVVMVDDDDGPIVIDDEEPTVVDKEKGVDKGKGRATSNDGPVVIDDDDTPDPEEALANRGALEVEEDDESVPMDFGSSESPPTGVVAGPSVQKKRPLDTTDQIAGGPRPLKVARLDTTQASPTDTTPEVPAPPARAQQTENFPVHCERVQGQEFIFWWPPLDGWYVVRCNGNDETSGRSFLKDPLHARRASNHFLDTNKKCHGPELAGRYSKAEIVQKFGHRVWGEALNAEWVAASNAKSKALAKEFARKTKEAKEGHDANAGPSSNGGASAAAGN